ncbi:MAG: hypothetical protein NC191_06670 [Muribaculaceae bacterium]|nr:hypothetical protein [Muribaculaceae bacterium]
MTPYRKVLNYKSRTKSETFNINGVSFRNTIFILKNGTILIFDINAADRINNNWCKATKDKTGPGRFYDLCGVLNVDITGNSKPNTNNKDLFGFKIYQDGITPMGNRDDNQASYYHTFSSACLQEKGSYGACTGWVLEQKNLDYQYCSDLSYDGKHSCSK